MLTLSMKKGMRLKNLPLCSLLMISSVKLRPTWEASLSSIFITRLSLTFELRRVVDKDTFFVANHLRRSAGDSVNEPAVAH